ncbi:hypothetical protein G3N95_04675 [Paraburkholderia sp. Tr-20389]|uniref:hypothetical protein n=1 Tax=Paraburkholderia sp. Tr-20389 TaxID=2703903 RepID=UPI001982625B|nr:hypothetical protein [Paraburkholderia sp. Tr-20389]MBN3752223.1 hypothetical protein [Paraburkholderia sp. Tr-20389]
MHPIDSGYPHRRLADPARFCFRYRQHRHHARAYDVFIELAGPEADCRIEIHHASGFVEERQPFTSGSLNARRLGSAVALLGLVDRVARKDRSRVEPGSLVFSARLKRPYVLRPTVATRLHARPVEEKARKASGTWPPARALRASPIDSVHYSGSLCAARHSPRARTRHRYPLRSI